MEKEIKDTNHPVNNLMLSQKPTGLPIDDAYAYIQKDFEKIGFDDAVGGADSSSCEWGKVLIKSGLIIEIENARRKYNDKLVLIERYLKEAELNGLLNTMSELEAKKKIYYMHLTALDVMENTPEEGNNNLINMYESYKRGFFRGFREVAREL